MSGIFISYRRSDASGYAGRLYDRLASHFGARKVFIDIDHIDPGDDFARTIDDCIHKSDVVLVLIGPGWLDATDVQGRSRLHLENDYVRIEVATALQRDITVIPVLLGRSAMPDSSALPPELRPLATRQAFSCSDERFHTDVDTLIGKIERKSGRWTKTRIKAVKAGRAVGVVSRWWRRAAALAILAGVTVASVVQVSERQTAGSARSDRRYDSPPPRTSSERSYSSGRYDSAFAGADSLAGKREGNRVRLDAIMQQYNRSAREIINSMGR